MSSIFSDAILAVSWSGGLSVAAVVVALILLAVVLGVSPKRAINEIIVDHNDAVAWFYRTVGLGIAFPTAIIFSDGFSPSAGFTSDLGWLAVALGLILVIGLLITAVMVFGMTSEREPGESFIVFLRREMIAEDNGALMMLFSTNFLIPAIIVPFMILG